MSRTPSIMIPLGTVLPTFSLPDVVSGNNITEQLLSGNISVVMFICNHCPYVKHVNKELVRLANDYMCKGVKFIAISANDAAMYPDDAPDKMKVVAVQLKYPFPYLYDESQHTARAFDAACTPDFYIFDKNKKLAYHGQLDDSRPSLNVPVTGKDIRDALDNLLNNKPVSALQRPGIGCNIKWKQSNS